MLAVSLLFSTSVMAAITVTAAPASVPPKGSATVTASGSDTGFMYALMTNSSGGAIDASTGVYTAGATGNVVDTVVATDSHGASGTANIMVGPGCSLAPLTPTVVPRGTQQFSAAGGSGTGYAWSLAPNNSGGHVNAITGAYAAGTTGGVTDTVRLTDSLGNTASTTVTVGPGVSITPPSATLAPGAMRAFVASGGSGAGYTWNFATNASGGTVGTTTAAYQAGARGSVTDSVRATDSLGNMATVLITVTAALGIVPASAGAPPQSQVAFGATGGSGAGLVWSLPANGSGGNVTPGGVYTAGPTPGVTDIVEVTDSLGMSAQASILLGPGVAVAPIAPTVPPRGSRTFGAAGGSSSGYVFTLAQNSSGGGINPSTGAYTAGGNGAVADVVRVVDSLGNVGATVVTVSPGVSLSPASAAIPPNTTLDFSAMGGSAMGFMYALAVNNSGGFVNVVTGQYTSGAVPATDTVRATDSLGNIADAVVTVTGALAITPPVVTLPPRGTQVFGGSGGSGAGYLWTLKTNSSGASFDPAFGAYTAGAVGGVVDQVQLRDSLNDVAVATINVSAGVGVSPPSATVPPRGTRSFSAGGGAGAGYLFSLSTNGSGGTLNATTGAYTAGTVAPATDVVAATDPLGNVGTASISVVAGVSAVPATTGASPRGSIHFTAVGGTGNGYVWSLMTNASGGSLTPVGAYRAGPTGSVMDVVLVSDALGNAATGRVSVSAAVSISPPSRSVAPRAMLAFSASGGTNAGFAWSFASNASGATLDPASGAYQAGPTPGVTDLIEVVDSIGNVGAAAVRVAGGLSITPAVATVAPRQSLDFFADGGSGNAYRWSLAPNRSGGSVGASTGVYTAGVDGGTGVMDLVQLVDGDSNTVSAPVTVGPGVSLAPTALPLPPRGRQQFTASGGSGSGFVYAFVTNASGGTLDAASGAYQAGAHGKVSDVVQVADGLGNTATATVTVGDELSITPAMVTLKARERQGFNAMGGSGTGYVWSLASRASGASIVGDTGLYTAGELGNVTDVVQVTDSLGNVQTAMVTVTSSDGRLPPEQQSPLNGFSCACGSSGPTPLLLAMVLLLRRARKHRRRTLNVER